jgi:NDP-4-keto-2,6-dideoxyhexose 3-C-methyltransferase
MRAKHHTRCRVCGAPDPVPVIDLGEQYLQGAFVKPGMPAPTLEKFPTRLVRCDASKVDARCGLVQLSHTVPPTLLYSNYWYRSGVNQTMRRHLRGIAEAAMRHMGESGARVLDIGCNDGTLLDSYPERLERWGVDPSDIALEIREPIRVVNALFPSDEVDDVVGEKRFDIITSIAMFYDLEDPVGFARGVRKLLADEGLWIVEMSYLPLMLRQNAFDTICHEHLEYYSLGVLERIAELAGLAAFRAEINGMNGGSLRLFLARADSARTRDAAGDSERRLAELRRREGELALNTDGPYREFRTRVERVREDLLSAIEDRRRAHRPLHVYGASTKGNVLLQWCGLTREHIECAADRNPAKHGARTLGTDIPIVSEDESRSSRPDYLVLPWHFKAEFLERERETILGGSAMIFPLPEVRTVTAENLDAEIALARSEDLFAI